MRPRLLDVFCCEGGASAGYDAAGFDVYGIDIEPQPNYRHPFYQGDAIDALRRLAAGERLPFRSSSGRLMRLGAGDFAARHASPPCQAYSTITPDKEKHPRLIAPVRELLTRLGGPYVIENVAGAIDDLRDPMMLCGSSFGLRVRRHRFFESNIWLSSIPCDHANQGRPVGVYGDHPQKHEYRRPDGTRRGMKPVDDDDARDAMRMPWASWNGCREAIPPAYSEFIGHQLIRECEGCI